MDNQSVADFEENLEENLADLLDRLISKRYRAKLVRRKNIPRREGKFRPLGIPAVEDKIVQMAARRILEAIYEADFLETSRGYRSGKGARHAGQMLQNETIKRALCHHSTIDRIREADAVIGERKREVLALNMRTRFIFCAPNDKSANASANFIGKRTIWKHTKTSKPFGMITTSRRREEEYYIEPSKLSRLEDHTAVTVHPSKHFIKKKIPPLDGQGKVYPWY